MSSSVPSPLGSASVMGGLRSTEGPCWHVACTDTGLLALLLPWLLLLLGPAPLEPSGPCTNAAMRACLRHVLLRHGAGLGTGWPDHAELRPTAWPPSTLLLAFMAARDRRGSWPGTAPLGGVG